MLFRSISSLFERRVRATSSPCFTGDQFRESERRPIGRSPRYPWLTWHAPEADPLSSGLQDRFAYRVRSTPTAHRLRTGSALVRHTGSRPHRPYARASRNPGAPVDLKRQRRSGILKRILAPPRQLTLKYALEFINDDEFVEVTPASIRLRTMILDHNERKRSEKAPKPRRLPKTRTTRPQSPKRRTSDQASLAAQVIKQSHV